ncbi:tellurite resistance TerB family protein [Pseudomonas saliphila]|uniref:tellurite resistance TerB family protein n=1 Tax=Pseudomonas saliphila TaxID=2586906 RepID=UPI00123B6B31|nr:tellurite resistance TerB family protein [Pseudomonas saliphila]
MITKSLLDQLLKSGSDLLQGQTGPASSRQTTGRSDSPLGGLLSGVGGGALGGTAIGLLMGNKKGRKVGKKVVTYGGLAALGVIAYKAYGNWQQRNGNTSAVEPRTVDRLPPPQVEEHSQAILRAVIGAAKADGHVDDRERELIEGEIIKLTEDRELQSWFDQELRKPLDPAEIAKSAGTPEMAAEMYLASLLMVDEENYMERAYLDELARQLKLDPELKTELERQAEQSAA